MEGPRLYSGLLDVRTFLIIPIKREALKLRGSYIPPFLVPVPMDSNYLLGILATSQLLNSPLAFAVISTLVVLIVAFPFAYSSTPTQRIDVLGGLSIIHAWNFFSHQYDFIHARFKKNDNKMFRFNILKHRMTVLSGLEARKAFFNEQSFDLLQGYGLMLGSMPDLDDLSIETDGGEKDGEFVRRNLAILGKDRIKDLPPILLEDMNAHMMTWGREGTMDPFREIYRLVFQMTIRFSTCKELAEDKTAVQNLMQCYADIDRGASPIAVMFPWFPSAARKAKEKGTLGLYTLLAHFVEKRRNSPVPSTDPIDVLLGQGLSTDSIVGTLIWIILGGVINTGVSACWSLLYLAANPIWREKVSAEFKVLLHKHTDTSSSEPLHKRLGMIPVSAWEEELPSADLVVRETIRLLLNLGIPRRNTQRRVTIEGVTIEKGDFVMYSAAKVHLNPDIYPNPTRFDPERYVPGREEDKKESLAYLGWGAGRHPCAGMKVAKLELKLVLALMVLGYDYSVVDKEGKRISVLPQPDLNDTEHGYPLGEMCYLKFRRLVE